MNKVADTCRNSSINKYIKTNWSTDVNSFGLYELIKTFIAARKKLTKEVQ